MQKAEGRNQVVMTSAFCILPSTFAPKNKSAAQSSGAHREVRNLARSVSERLVDRFLDHFLGFGLRNAFHDRHFRDDQVLGPVVHLLFAERETLLACDFAEVLQHVGDVFQPARLHLLEIVAVAALPVSVTLDELRFEKADQTFDLLLLIQPAKSDALGVTDRNYQSRVIREKPQMVVVLSRLHDRRLADMLDDGDSVVRIDELFSDLES